METKNLFPRWDELPVLDLYLDQVLLYVNKVCMPAFTASDKGLTASMINNYVKHGYLEKPSKKKYNRQQVARLIAITSLKTVFSIQDIAATLDMLNAETQSEELYNDFVDYMNGQKLEVTPIIASACQTLKLYQQTLAFIQIPEKEVDNDELRA
ncbi:BS_ykrK family protein [Streptococcus cristatus]|uniref:DUF1836 domain-containing protein n=2 Tax=Streptococcus cristatus TaxID=45634 RepID=A0A512AA38_STRCR|nr:DUF1836 domain-containing protein [Streptococcus cristatus]AGK70801.1 hypothetical protein I872_03505 [Streptococcus cristatus AS 1.3089]GEN96529.1 hypothetical protein SOL01_04030 [Streptococcus cristatus]SQI46771.1 BS_ykrK family protein [Streptococcus cristatus]